MSVETVEGWVGILVIDKSFTVNLSSNGSLKYNAAVGKLDKSPDLQSGQCGFDPRRQYKLK